MSDTTLNRFVSRGTHAQRLAYTPSPPTPASGPSSGYFFFETDTGDTFSWDGAAWAQVNATGTGITQLTGDVTAGPGSGSQAATIANDAVSNAKLRNSGALSVIGRSANSAGDPADISASAASDQVLRESGSVLGFGTVATAGIANDAVTYAKIQNVSAASRLLGRGDSGSGDVEEISLSGVSMSGTTLKGRVIQVVNTQTGAVNTGTTTIPHDDTIPQNTEGDEYMTLAITPTSSSHKLKIEVVVMLSATNASQWLAAALFQDTTANALAAGTVFDATATAMQIIAFTHYMTAGTTSSTTFKVRAGRDVAGTTTFNGQSGGRIFGGVLASSITITEITA